MENDAPNVEYERRNVPIIDLGHLYKRSTPKTTTLMSTHRTNIDAAQLRTFDSGLFSPPSSQVGVVVDASKMLISPPPEEILRSNDRYPVSLLFCFFTSHPHIHSLQPSHTKSTRTPSRHPLPPSVLAEALVSSAGVIPPKRKRPTNSSFVSIPTDDVTADHIGTLEITPNPKPRKQSKCRSRTISVDSPTRATFSCKSSINKKSRTFATSTHHEAPYATKRNANYAPRGPSPRQEVVSSRRRSVTPIPPYEPPPEQFTPPREVVIAPVVSHASRVTKSSKRQSTAKLSKVLVKNEPPDVDLSLPLPPPSPTDDPLLLSGPPVASSRSRFRKAKPTLARLRLDPIPPYDKQAQPCAVSSTSPTLVSSIILDPRVSHDPNTFNVDVTSHALPLFEPEDLSGFDNGWSDSDSDLSRSDDYREKFTVMTVPTKVDSPVSQTGAKPKKCGSTSPFPGTRSKDSRIPKMAEMMDQATNNIRTDSGDKSECTTLGSCGGGLSPFAGRYQRNTDSDDIRLNGAFFHNPDVDIHMTFAPEPAENLNLSRSFSAAGNDGTDDKHDDRAPKDVETLQSDSSLPTLPVAADDTIEKEKGVIDHTWQCPSILLTEDMTSPQKPQWEDGDHMLVATCEGDDEDDDSDSMDIGLVRITSHDPKAAARAAAILKQVCTVQPYLLPALIASTA